MIVYFVCFECGMEDREGPTLGPFSHPLQITYEYLRCGPEGQEIAVYSECNEAGVRAPGWYISQEFSSDDGRYSDMLIWAEDRPGPRSVA